MLDVKELFFCERLKAKFYLEDFQKMIMHFNYKINKNSKISMAFEVFLLKKNILFYFLFIYLNLRLTYLIKSKIIKILCLFLFF